MVDIGAYHGTDAWYELSQFAKVYIVAVFLLEIPPVELVDVVRQFLAHTLPVFHNGEDLAPSSLAGERKLEDVEDVNTFAIVFRVDAVARGDFEQHFHFQGKPDGEVGQPEEHPAKPGDRTFGSGGGAVEVDTAQDILLPGFQGVERAGFACGEAGAKEHAPCRRFVGRGVHVVDVLWDDPSRGHLDIFRDIVDQPPALGHLPLPRLEFTLNFLALFQRGYRTDPIASAFPEQAGLAF